jgi:hypothetical protein
VTGRLTRLSAPATAELEYGDETTFSRDDSARKRRGFRGTDRSSVIRWRPDRPGD